MSDEVVVICDDPLYRCRCIKPAGHVEAGDDVHACSPEVCGGSWLWFDEHQFYAPTFPKGEWLGAVLPPPEWIDNDFVQCDEDGEPIVIPDIGALRGAINFLPPPSLLLGLEP